MRRPRSDGAARRAGRAEPAPSILSNAHIPSAGGALCAVWGVTQLVRGALGWAFTGFVATAVYFLVTAAQRIATDRWRRAKRSA